VSGETTRQQDEAADRLLERHQAVRVTRIGPAGVSAVVLTPCGECGECGGAGCGCCQHGAVAVGDPVRVLPDGRVLDAGPWRGRCRGGTIRWAREGVAP
jgi:hypothetical protein